MSSNTPEYIYKPAQKLDPQELAPQELFNNVDATKSKMVYLKTMDELINLFYKNNLFKDEYITNGIIQHELEVKFGTKRLKGLKPLTKTDYDNVVSMFKSMGFSDSNLPSVDMLRIKSQFVDRISGKHKMSNLRTEIKGSKNIETYCKTNNPTDMNVTFQQKKKYIDPNGATINAIDVDNFNFRVDLNVEETIYSNTGISRFVLDKWSETKKEFRYVNRVTFTHANYPFKIDLSITKSGDKEEYLAYDGRTKNTRIKPVYSIKESNVFNNPKVYEIEIELDTSKIGPNNKLFDTADKLMVSLRKVIKYVLSGLQALCILLIIQNNP